MGSDTRLLQNGFIHHSIKILLRTKVKTKLFPIRLGKRTFFCELWNFWETDLAKKTRKLQLILIRKKNSVNQIFYQIAYFASFIGYKTDILEVISNLHVEGAKFGGKKVKSGGIFFLS